MSDRTICVEKEERIGPIWALILASI